MWSVGCGVVSRTGVRHVSSGCAIESRHDRHEQRQRLRPCRQIPPASLAARQVARQVAGIDTGGALGAIGTGTEVAQICVSDGDRPPALVDDRPIRSCRSARHEVPARFSPVWLTVAHVAHGIQRMCYGFRQKGPLRDTRATDQRLLKNGRRVGRSRKGPPRQRPRRRLRLRELGGSILGTHRRHSGGIPSRPSDKSGPVAECDLAESIPGELSYCRGLSVVACTTAYMRWEGVSSYRGIGKVRQGASAGGFKSGEPTGWLVR